MDIKPECLQPIERSVLAFVTADRPQLAALLISEAGRLGWDPKPVLIECEDDSLIELIVSQYDSTVDLPMSLLVSGISDGTSWARQYLEKRAGRLTLPVDPRSWSQALGYRMIGGDLAFVRLLRGYNVPFPKIVTWPLSLALWTKGQVACLDYAVRNI